MRRWPLVAAVALVLGLAVLTVVALGRDDPPPVAATRGFSLPLPASAGEWERVEDDATARTESAFQESVDREVGDVDVAVALYERGDGDRFRLTALVPEPGGTTSRALRADPGGQLGDFLDGAGLADRRAAHAAESGTSLVCGTLSGGDGFGRACGWADRWALALVAYDADDLRAAEAATLTREVRAALAR